MTVKNPSRFYRVGSSRLAQVTVGRSAPVGYRTDESWEPCSAVFNDPGAATGKYSDIYTDTYEAPVPDTRAMKYIQPLWATYKTDTTATLTARINAELVRVGYVTVAGGTIS